MDHLLELIKSLTKREKFYFKRFYNQSHQKNFVRLYDFLIKHPSSDIDSIKNHFKKESISRNVHYEVNHLFHKILRVLSVYRMNKSSTNFHILQMLQYVDILIEKKQLGQAIKLIAKAKATAYKYEELSILMKIIEIEEELRFTQIDSNIAENIKQLEEERVHIAIQKNEYNKLRLLKNQFVDFQFKVGLITATPENHTNLFEHEILNSIDDIKTKKGKDLWYFNKGLAYSLVGNYKEAKKVRESRLSFVRANQDLFEVQDEIVVLNNYLFLMVQMKDTVSFYEKHSDLLRLLEEGKLPERTVLFFSFYLRLALFIALENKEEINKLFPAVFEFIKNNIEKINATQQFYLFFYLTKAMITIRDFHKALTVLNIWNRSRMEGIRFIRFKILWLITHYSLGNIGLLTSELYNLSKMIKSKKIENHNLDILIRFLKKVLKENDKNTLYLKELESSFLEPYKDIPNHYIHIYEVDLAHWARNFKPYV